MDILRILKENCIVHKDQGYALYFYQDGKEYQELNGKVRDNESENITFDTNFGGWTGATSEEGSGTAHENRPPYYALAFIMKIK